MSYFDLFVELLKIFWFPLLIIAIAFCLAVKYVYDEVQYMKWRKEELDRIKNK